MHQISKENAYNVTAPLLAPAMTYWMATSNVPLLVAVLTVLGTQLSTNRYRTEIADDSSHKRMPLATRSALLGASIGLVMRGGFNLKPLYDLIVHRKLPAVLPTIWRTSKAAVQIWAGSIFVKTAIDNEW